MLLRDTTLGLSSLKSAAGRGRHSRARWVHPGAFRAAPCAPCPCVPLRR